MTEAIKKEREGTAKEIRMATREVLAGASGNRMEFSLLFKMVGEIVFAVCPNVERLRRDYFISSLLTPNSNIAVISNGATLHVTYAHLIPPIMRAGSVQTFKNRKSNAEKMRKKVRDSLARSPHVSFHEMKDVIRSTMHKDLRIPTLLINKSGLAVISGKAMENGNPLVYVTAYDRVSF